MTTEANSRRQLIRLAAMGALAAPAIVASVRSAQAYQGNMERALASLQSALRDLHQATSDKGGHKATAARLIQQAMGEVQAGIDFAAERFGD